MPEWLKKAVFYEIYPQTFYDSNADGIGDIKGIIEKLDYVKSLGCNAIWLNPCFDSPFKDAGYDVRDFKKVAPRYGTNEDLFNLFDIAHKKDMRVILDLVAGHTSEEHNWFKESSKAKPNDEYKNRFIWTNNWFCFGLDGLKFIAGEVQRNGVYIINFFKCQPALNYGFKNQKENWQLPPDHPDCIETREALKDVMRYWLKGDAGRGCDGFRVDMADSLVKFDDGEKSSTCAIWRNIREMLDAEFPQSILVSEWSNPRLSLKAGFHIDFLLDHDYSGYRSLVRDYEDNIQNNSYFRKDAAQDINKFLSQYIPWYEETKNTGYISLISGNHDTFRISYKLDTRELALFYAFMFTMPGVPFLYYGDEIGMSYLPDTPTKEGGYSRTGSRTPMQWKRGTNMGFSLASKENLYLDVDANTNAPNVEEQEKDDASLLNIVKNLLRLRQSEEDLQSKPNLEIIHAPKDNAKDRSFFFKRGSFLIGINPGTGAVNLSLAAGSEPKLLYSIGNCGFADGNYRLDTQSFGVWKS